MNFPVLEGSVATCGHVAIGNTDVTVQGLPVCVVGESIAGGIIAGPGATKVFIAGRPMSILGDAVAPHGKSPHRSASLPMPLSTRVIVQ